MEKFRGIFKKEPESVVPVSPETVEAIELQAEAMLELGRTRREMGLAHVNYTDYKKGISISLAKHTDESQEKFGLGGPYAFSVEQRLTGPHDEVLYESGVNETGDKTLFAKNVISHDRQTGEYEYSPRRVLTESEGRSVLKVLQKATRDPKIGR